MAKLNQTKTRKSARNHAAANKSGHIDKGAKGSEKVTGSKKNKVNEGKGKNMKKQHAERRDFRHEDEGGDVEKYDQYRSSLVSFSKLMSTLTADNKRIGLRHENLLRITPFWNLYSAYKANLVNDKLYHKSDKILAKLIRRYDTKINAFRIGGRVVKFETKQVSEILGLPCEGDKLTIHTHQQLEHAFGKRYFTGLRQLFLAKITSTIKDVVMSKDENDVRDTVSLICLHFCTSLLFANTGTSIKWYIVNIVGDIEKMAGYNWAQAVRDWLVDDISKKQHRLTTVTGCTIILLFWLCEVTNIIDPINDRTNMEPRFLRWDLSKLTAALSNVDFDDTISKCTWNARLVDYSDSSDESENITTVRKRKSNFNQRKQGSMDMRPIKKVKEEHKKCANESPTKHGSKIPDFFKRSEEIVTDNDYQSVSEDDDKDEKETGVPEKQSKNTQERHRKGASSTSSDRSISYTENLIFDDDVEYVPMSPIERDYVSATPSPMKSPFDRFRGEEQVPEKESRRSDSEARPNSGKKSRRRLRKSNRDSRPKGADILTGDLEDDSAEIRMTPEKTINSVEDNRDDNGDNEIEKQGVSKAQPKSGRKKSIARNNLSLRDRLKKSYISDSDDNIDNDVSASFNPRNAALQSADLHKFQGGEPKGVDNTGNKTKHKTSEVPDLSSEPKSFADGSNQKGQDSQGHESDKAENEVHEDHVRVASERNERTPQQSQQVPLHGLKFVPSFDISYVRKLEYDRKDLLSKNIILSDKVTKSEIQMKDRASRCEYWEKCSKNSDMRLRRLRFEFEREKTRAVKLHDDNQKLRRELESTRAQLAAREKEVVAAKINALETSLAQCRRVKETSDLPSFELLTQQTAKEVERASGSSISKQFENDIIHNRRNAEMYQLKLNETQAILAVCQEQLDLLRESKIKNENEFHDKYKDLEAKLNEQKRTNESLREAAKIMHDDRQNLQSKNKELCLKDEDQKQKLWEMEILVEEMILKNRVLQSQLDLSNPLLLRDDLFLSPSSMVKNVRARHRGEDAPVNNTVRESSKLDDDAFDYRVNKKVDRNVNEVGGKSVASEPIEILDNSDEDKERTISFTPQRKINFVKLKVAKYLSPEVKEMIRVFWQKTSPEATVWERGPDAITCNDINKILSEGAITTKIIDAYGQILGNDANMLENQPALCTILSSFAWVMVEKNNEAGKQRLIHDPLMRTFHSAIRVFIPLIHENKTHFSLLCLDLDRDGWYHMNPLKPRRANGKDQCYEDARRMYEEVQSFFHEVKTNGENILNNGFKKVLSSRDGSTKYTNRPLERVEISMISHLLQTDIDYKFNVPEICPQQEATSVDCGIAVLYYMKQLSFGVPIEKKFRKNTMHQMRAEIIEAFLKNTDAIDPFNLTDNK